MPSNKMPNYNPEQKIGGVPLPEISISEQSSDVGREGSERIGDLSEKDNSVSVPEISGGFSNYSAMTAPINNEAKIIESIMEEGLGEMYMKMLPPDQQKFRQKGEETANLIVKVLSQPKVKIKKIFELIRSWLKIIPGVNRFFLEQTAKIKTDRIVSAAKDKKII
jgi:hypothetical protein